MVKDYSGSCIANNFSNRKMKIADFRLMDYISATKLIWKTLGVVLFVTVILGITSTVWYGWKIQLALDQIGSYQKSYNELTNENKLLVAQRDLMLTEDHMEKAAQKIGLFSPEERQLRYPR
ncbi:MAG: hypothetical protein JRF02_00750 [Deltaproteobacteria bacterium]|jgi:hypothetical protein|nr:hypothetical protein [Deltaproteobacteria bacterium]